MQLDEVMLLVLAVFSSQSAPAHALGVATVATLTIKTLKVPDRGYGANGPQPPPY